MWCCSKCNFVQILHMLLIFFQKPLQFLFLLILPLSYIIPFSKLYILISKHQVITLTLPLYYFYSLTLILYLKSQILCRRCQFRQKDILFRCSAMKTKHCFCSNLQFAKVEQSKMVGILLRPPNEFPPMLSSGI